MLVQALTCVPQTTQAGLSAGAPVESDTGFKHGELSYTAKLAAELAPDVNSYISYSRG